MGAALVQVSLQPPTQICCQLDFGPRCNPAVWGWGWGAVLWLFSVPGFYFPGVDLITACDIRYCTQDASFQVKVSHPTELLPWALLRAGK